MLVRRGDDETRLIFSIGFVETVAAKVIHLFSTLLHVTWLTADYSSWFVTTSLACSNAPIRRAVSL